MENEKKYVLTIDGTDCTGKTTLWNNAILNSDTRNVQIRGIVSNVAYAFKFGRNVDELIDLYNQNPVNYVVYLINPNNETKLKYLHNRLNNYIYDTDRLLNELKDAHDTWNDMAYFKRAIDYLHAHYKGEIVVYHKSNNSYDEFKNLYDTYADKLLKTSELENIEAFKIIKCNYTNFEKRAKEASEFKYIVLFEQADKETTIEELMQSLNSEHFDMFSNLSSLTDLSYEEIYDDMDCKDYEFTVQGLTDYLDDYDIECTSDVTVTLCVSTNHSIKLSDLGSKKYYDLEECILDSSYETDIITEALQDELQWAEYDSFSVEVNR